MVKNLKNDQKFQKNYKMGKNLKNGKKFKK